MSLTFAWGDPDAELYGSVHVGPEPLALLFSGTELVVADTGGEVEVESDRVRWETGEGGWELTFAPLTPPLAVGDAAEEGCRVTGEVRTGGRRVTVDCLGQRGERAEAPDPEDVVLARTLSAWLGRDRFVALGAVRPEGADGHADEDVEAWLVSPDEPGPLRVDEARISTTYDGAGRQLRAGVELWPQPDSPYPRRLGGEVRCGTSVALGASRLDAAFFHWTMDGQRGVGRYDVLRRA